MKREFFLQTKRIGFSIWNPKDQELANVLWSNPQVTKYICASGIFNQEEIEERLQLEINNYAQYHIQYWPIFHLESQEFMGCCGLRNLNEGLEMGVHLRPEFWHQGYATEAAKTIIDYAFSILKTQVLYVGHHPQNSASRHLVNKLGFQSIGDKFYPPTGLYHPAYEIRRMRVYVASAFCKNNAVGNKAGVVFQSDYLSTDQKMKI